MSWKESQSYLLLGVLGVLGTNLMGTSFIYLEGSAMLPPKGTTLCSNPGLSFVFCLKVLSRQLTGAQVIPALSFCSPDLIVTSPAFPRTPVSGSWKPREK